MILKRNEEIINHPLPEWIDDTGKVWSNPTVDFLMKRGWVEYVAPQPIIPLSDRQAQSWLNIKAERDQRKSGGVFVSGKWFHTDTESRVQWLGLVIMGASVPPIQWKTMDGTFIELTAGLVGSVFQTIANGDSADFANAETHRAAMLQSPTPEDYDYSTGWRGVYQA
jgi:hypothetical protein